MFLDILQDIKGEVKQSVAHNSQVKKTMYGCEFLATIIDEAHSVRKFNKLHTAYHELRQCSRALIAMTATPVMTKLQVHSYQSECVY